MRRGEIFSLKWNDIDLRQGIITIRESKSGESRRISVNDDVMNMLSNVKKNSDTYVFPGKKGKRIDNIASAFQASRDKAGLKDFRFHDLRHTFASHLVMNGVDLTTVKELMGHKDIKMTLRYSHLAPEHTKSAVNKIGKIVRNSVENSQYGQASVKEANSANPSNSSNPLISFNEPHWNRTSNLRIKSPLLYQLS